MQEETNNLEKREKFAVQLRKLKKEEILSKRRVQLQLVERRQQQPYIQLYGTTVNQINSIFTDQFDFLQKIAGLN